jgi:hypothetical protein
MLTEVSSCFSNSLDSWIAKPTDRSCGTVGCQEPKFRQNSENREEIRTGGPSAPQGYKTMEFINLYLRTDVTSRHWWIYYATILELLSRQFGASLVRLPRVWVTTGVHLAQIRRAPIQMEREMCMYRSKNTPHIFVVIVEEPLRVPSTEHMQVDRNHW